MTLRPNIERVTGTSGALRVCARDVRAAALPRVDSARYAEVAAALFAPGNRQHRPRRLPALLCSLFHHFTSTFLVSSLCTIEYFNCINLKLSSTLSNYIICVFTSVLYPYNLFITIMSTWHIESNHSQKNRFINILHLCKTKWLIRVYYVIKPMRQK